LKNRLSLILTLSALLLIAPAVFAAPDGDHEIVGTVTQLTDTTVTIETTAGNLVSFQIVEQSLLPETLSVGDTVQVNHYKSDEGSPEGSNLHPITEVLIADDVTLQVNKPEPMEQDSMQAEPMAAEPQMPAEPMQDEQEPMQYETDSQSYDTLPQTASPLAALALLGLTSLGGAFFLRRRNS
jgi:LPXTG-motif cell wall-anchored protein